VKGEFSLADVAVASYLLYVIQFFPDVDLHSKWPNIVRYMKDCAAREAYGKAFGANVQGFCLERLGDMQSGDKKKLFGVF
jgi:glutathione S-transferase